MLASHIHCYPVKSCRGVELAASLVGPFGLANDRRFMVIKPDGNLLSQRQKPFMAQIEVSIDADGLSMSAPGHEPLRVVPTGAGDVRDVTLWDTPCKVVDQGASSAAWLSAVLETEAHLVAMAEGYERPVHPMLPRELNGTLLFADAAPLLVVSEASLEDLNARLPSPLPMDRFRPNIVVSGCEPYAEDDWEQIRVGDVELTRVIPCGRCSITTTDQATGERGKEPLRTLATYRKHEVFGPIFGTYYAHRATGRIAAGDPVVAL